MAAVGGISAFRGVAPERVAPSRVVDNGLAKSHPALSMRGVTAGLDTTLSWQEPTLASHRTVDWPIREADTPRCRNSGIAPHTCRPGIDRPIEKAAVEQVADVAARNRGPRSNRALRYGNAIGLSSVRQAGLDTAGRIELAANIPALDADPRWAPDLDHLRRLRTALAPKTLSNQTRRHLANAAMLSLPSQSGVEQCRGDALRQGR